MLCPIQVGNAYASCVVKMTAFNKAWGIVKVDQSRCALCGTEALDFGMRGDGPAYQVDEGDGMLVSYCGECQE